MNRDGCPAPTTLTGKVAALPPRRRSTTASVSDASCTGPARRTATSSTRSPTVPILARSLGHHRRGGREFRGGSEAVDRERSRQCDGALRQLDRAACPATVLEGRRA